MSTRREAIPCARAAEPTSFTRVAERCSWRYPNGACGFYGSLYETLRDQVSFLGEQGKPLDPSRAGLPPPPQRCSWETRLNLFRLVNLPHQPPPLH